MQCLCPPQPSFVGGIAYCLYWLRSMRSDKIKSCRVACDTICSQKYCNTSLILAIECKATLSILLLIIIVYFTLQRGKIIDISTYKSTNTAVTFDWDLGLQKREVYIKFLLWSMIRTKDSSILISRYKSWKKNSISKLFISYRPSLQ